MTKWADLVPEPEIVAALAHAGNRPEAGDQNKKRNWSERFANGCAIAVASALRKSKELKSRKVRPQSLEEGTEPLTPLGAGTSKRIDVTVSDEVLGLELGVSLKGLNFRDKRSQNFDKNLTGRLYEIADEVRMVHEHLPHAFMIGIFFLPLDSTEDKIKGNSSFANAVTKLRTRTGRLDPAIAGHASRCDSAYVGLYTTGAEGGGYPKGLVRFSNVLVNPPKRGRPRIEDTLSLDEMIHEIVAEAMHSSGLEWGEPEPEA